MLLRYEHPTDVYFKKKNMLQKYVLKGDKYKKLISWIFNQDQTNTSWPITVKYVILCSNTV